MRPARGRPTRPHAPTSSRSGSSEPTRRGRTCRRGCERQRWSCGRPGGRLLSRVPSTANSRSSCNRPAQPERACVGSSAQPRQGCTRLGSRLPSRTPAPGSCGSSSRWPVRLVTAWPRSCERSRWPCVRPAVNSRSRLYRTRELRGFRMSSWRLLRLRRCCVQSCRRQKPGFTVPCRRSPNRQRWTRGPGRSRRSSGRPWRQERGCAGRSKRHKRTCRRQSCPAPSRPLAPES
mmetsp:Transcript_38900/g.108230  ORF Transcript_38900/g.108230 Transcript_38900/m.108230 type:complete len:233 (-) Transcript_38900:1416-2114(-)